MGEGATHPSDRYVDYSCATPFENAVVELENILRTRLSNASEPRSPWESLQPWIHEVHVLNHTCTFGWSGNSKDEGRFDFLYYEPQDRSFDFSTAQLYQRWFGLRCCFSVEIGKHLKEDGDSERELQPMVLLKHMLGATIMALSHVVQDITVAPPVLVWNGSERLKMKALGYLARYRSCLHMESDITKRPERELLSMKGIGELYRSKCGGVGSADIEASALACWSVTVDDSASETSKLQLCSLDEGAETAAQRSHTSIMAVLQGGPLSQGKVPEFAHLGFNLHLEVRTDSVRGLSWFPPKGSPDPCSADDTTYWRAGVAWSEKKNENAAPGWAKILQSALAAFVLAQAASGELSMTDLCNDTAALSSHDVALLPLAALRPTTRALIRKMAGTSYAGSKSSDGSNKESRIDTEKAIANIIDELWSEPNHEDNSVQANNQSTIQPAEKEQNDLPADNGSTMQPKEGPKYFVQANDHLTLLGEEQSSVLASNQSNIQSGEDKLESSAIFAAFKNIGIYSKDEFSLWLGGPVANRAPGGGGNLAPVGRFVSVFSIRCAELAAQTGSLGAVAALWSNVLKRLRSGWENGVPVARMTPIPAVDGFSMWNDEDTGQSCTPAVQLRSHVCKLTNNTTPGAESERVPPPDMRLCPLHQKLQLLNWCVTEKENNRKISENTSSCAESAVRLEPVCPMTSDMLEQHRFVINKLQAPPIAPGAVEVERQMRLGVLIRDMADFRHMNTSSITSSNFDTSNALGNAVLNLPVSSGDQHVEPSLHDFLAWYRGEGMNAEQSAESLSVSHDDYLWAWKEAETCSDTSFRFKPDQEAERVLHSLEVSTPGTIMAQVLSSVVAAVAYALSQYQRTAQSCQLAPVKEALNIAQTRLCTAARELEDTVRSCGGGVVIQGRMEQGISQVMLAACDEACAAVLTAEQLMWRGNTLLEHFPGAHELASSLLSPVTTTQTQDKDSLSRPTSPKKGVGLVQKSQRNVPDMYASVNSGTERGAIQQLFHLYRRRVLGEERSSPNQTSNPEENAVLTDGYGYPPLPTPDSVEYTLRTPHLEGSSNRMYTWSDGYKLRVSMVEVIPDYV